LYYYDSKEKSTIIPPFTSTVSSLSSNELKQQRVQELKELDEEKRKQRAKNFYHVLVSFSSIGLFDLQKMFLVNLKQQSLGKAVTAEMIGRLNSIKAKFESECEEFFSLLKRKHEDNVVQFNLGLLNLTREFHVNTTDSREEYLKKVQFLKLCDLNEIYKILLYNGKSSSSTGGGNASSKQDLANNYIKNSTEELLFNQIELTTGDSRDDESSESDESESETSTNTIILNKSVEKEDKKDGNDKQQQQQNDTVFVKSKSSMAINMTSEEDPPKSYFAKFKLALTESMNKTKKWFWKVVPEEDFLLAVIVPLVVIVAMIILTIVVTCMLQMCNKEYRGVRKSKKEKKLQNQQQQQLLGSPNTTTATTNSAASPKTPSHGTLTKSSNPIYKQRAYLSKGVPVILYEEMSDKVKIIYFVQVR
jgi:hypothetical protein